MTDTCGPTWQMPFAYYDPDSRCLRTSQATFPWDSTPSSPTLPAWGSMQGGELFARPTPAPLTVARDCSSLQLPTPTASEGPGYTDRNNGGGRNLRTEVSLLPTPSAMDGAGAMTPDARMASGEGYGPALRDIRYLLPTSAATPPPSPGGNTSSDDQPLPLLNPDGTSALG